MEKQIHPTAIISDGAKIGENVSIGAYSIIGPNVVIGEGTIIHPHVVITNHVRIGKNNQIYQFASIGAPPQDYSFKGEPTRVEIGDNNIFREYVSVNIATTKENRVTVIGSNNFFMTYVHIAHDCIIGNKCTIVNSVNLAGHVKIRDRVIIGGGTNISQFISVGRGAYIGGASGINKDIPAFCTAYGNRILLKGVNIVGLRRAGVDRQKITEVVDFVRQMEASALSAKAFVDHPENIQEYKGNEIVMEMVNDIRSSEVGIAPFDT